MAYGSRLDCPGSTHHVMCRAVDGCAPFRDEDHSTLLMECIGKAWKKHDCSIIAWAIMPNHLHLLLRCREKPLSGFIRSILVRYAMTYNKAHQRRGHLFQGRFRSTLVQEGRYVLELIRYIHLNPLRSEIVQSIDQLAVYPFTGHSGVVSGAPEEWHDVESLLTVVSEDSADARQKYDWLLSSDDWRESDSIELIAGNWLLGSSGLVERTGDSLTARRYEYWGSILGSRDFTLDIVRKMKQQDLQSMRERVPATGLIIRGCEYMGVSRALLTSSSRSAGVVNARRLMARFLIEEAGLTLSDTARLLRHTPSAVSKMLHHAVDDSNNSVYLKMVVELGPMVKSDLEA